MAFAMRNLSVLAYANGFTLWHYRTATETQKTVSSPNFFGEARDMVSSGDMMMLSAADGGSILFVKSENGIIRAKPFS